MGWTRISPAAPPRCVIKTGRIRHAESDLERRATDNRPLKRASSRPPKPRFRQKRRSPSTLIELEIASSTAVHINNNQVSQLVPGLGYFRLATSNKRLKLLFELCVNGGRFIDIQHLFPFVRGPHAHVFRASFLPALNIFTV